MRIDIILKSISHNIGVTIVGFLFAFIGYNLNLLFGFNHSFSHLTFVAGVISIYIGFFIRVWATYYFYKYKMGVIVLHPQKRLITTGPYRFSRNPLYLGGNVFIFLGASLVLKTSIGVIITFLHLPLVDLMIRREEKQLEETFGKEWIDYKKKVRRWI